MPQACLNGTRPDDAHPRLPISPYPLAPDVRAVVELGVRSVHLPSGQGPIAAAALLLVERSDRGWVRLLGEHIDDGSGHCGSCGGQSGASPAWPCSLFHIAEHARRLAQARRAGQGHTDGGA